MAIIKGRNKNLTLNVQHDYITLRTPNGNYTIGRSGAKASGNLSKHPTAFKSIDDFVFQGVGTKLDLMKKLLVGTTLSKLWKEWNATPKTNDFIVGKKASFEKGLFSKKYPGTYNVMKVAKKYVYLSVPNKKTGKNEIIGFDFNDLIKK